MSEYRRKTPVLGIPVVANGDRIDPEIEMKKALIIENQILAGTKGVSCMIFEEGEFSFLKRGTDEYDVRLSNESSVLSVSGVINGFFFYVTEALFWRGLKTGEKYFLYLKGKDDLPYNKGSVREVYLSAYRKTGNKNFMLMAIVDLRSESPTIDPYPDGKIYAEDLSLHLSDKVNPHGVELVQDTLVVREFLKLTSEDEDTVPVVSNKEITLIDKRVSVNLSDDNNHELQTESKSLIGAINEINKKLTEK